MKHFTLVILALISSQVLAAPAVIYSCIGKDALSEQAVSFDITFSEFDPEIGYANQSITVLRQGWENLEKPIVLQMFESKDKNECSRNEQGEIYLSSENMNMTPTEGKEPAEYRVSFKIGCFEVKLQVEGYCFFQ